MASRLLGNLCNIVDTYCWPRPGLRVSPRGARRRAGERTPQARWGRGARRTSLALRPAPAQSSLSSSSRGWWSPCPTAWCPACWARGEGLLDREGHDSQLAWASLLVVCGCTQPPVGW